MSGKIMYSDRSEMDSAIEALQDRKDSWLNLSLERRLQILDDALKEFGAIRDEWVALGLAAKQSIGNPYDAGWEWTGFLAAIRYLQGLRKTLRFIAKKGRVPLPSPFAKRSNGQLVSRVFPLEFYERLTTPGVTADVWMEPGLSEREILEDMALSYQGKQKQGKVTLVLGAGNVSGIPVNDSLTKLFVEQNVVLLKMNPINEYLGPLIAKGFRQLIDEGFLRVVYGGAAEGEYLCHHPGVDEIHITGSDRTYEAIIFGAGPESEQRKKNHECVLTKRFTAELGNISPAIVVPGPWSDSDIRYQAEQLVSHLCDDGSYSCSRTRVILQHANWRLRRQLLGGIRDVLRELPSRADHYPGAARLYERFLSAHPETEQFGSREEGKLPWGLIAEIDSLQWSDICFKTESFCPIIAETAIEATSVVEFIDHAVKFANERLWGTLSATIIVHPRSLKDPAVYTALDRAMENLRYGAIIVNSIPGLAWAMTTPPWGSYPGNRPWNIQSGTGFVHNTFMFPRPQKVVVRAPFRTWPRPLWFPSRAIAFERVIREVVRYELEPCWWRILKIMWGALKG